MRWDSVSSLANHRASAATAASTSFPKFVHILIHVSVEEAFKSIQSCLSVLGRAAALRMTCEARAGSLGSTRWKERTYTETLTQTLWTPCVRSVLLHAGLTLLTADLQLCSPRSAPGPPRPCPSGTLWPHPQSIALGLCLFCLFKWLQMASKTYKPSVLCAHPSSPRSFTTQPSLFSATQGIHLFFF